RVSDREIRQAIEKAMVDKGQIINYDFKSKKRAEPKPSFDGVKARQRIIDAGAGITEADIWSASPVKIDWAPEEDPLHLLRYLYQPDDMLFIGERYSPGMISKTIRTTADWQQYFSKGGKTFPHIIPNPLSGLEGLTQDGKPSFRADSCVKSFRFAVVEFDDLNREDQLAFWGTVWLPVVALIDSGNKSLHAWVRIDNIQTADQWTAQVENHLFRQILEPLGVDGACRNEARLSRLPGHLRDTGKMQRLIFLAPGGRRVSG
ncbi:MAG: hypothetical protein U9P07_11630, partial [Pseudomonadota bacterium]|nr:hypothetical protein [Pseudomonadota bacterium]